MVLVQLSDGSSSEMKITLGSPVRLIHKDGGFEYRMNINSNLSVTQSEKTPSGNVKVQSRDGLSWEIPGAIQEPGQGYWTTSPW